MSTLPPLRVGSPLARNLHQLWSGAPIITVEPERDMSPMRTAALLLGHLDACTAGSGNQRRLVHVVVGKATACFSAAQQWSDQFEACGIDTTVWWRDTWAELTVGVCRSDAQADHLRLTFHPGLPTYGTFPPSDLLVVELGQAPFMAEPDRRFTNAAGQLLLVGTASQPEPPVEPKLARVARGSHPGFWGDMPTEVVLAGVPG